MDLPSLLADDALRHEHFPVTAERPYFGHAGVAPLSGPARRALETYAERGSVHNQERGWIWQVVHDLRANAARLIGAGDDEIALIGPTALGLNLVALGLDWRPGDRVVYYGDDYPANVYPWTALARLGVEAVPLRPERPGVITPELVAAAIDERTRLVALASCHYLTGYRIDVDAIGRAVHDRGALFCLDGIQTLGAFPTRVDHVDFLAADSHKWLCGPCGAGIFYCDRRHFATLRPALVGAWNIESPDYVAQGEQHPVAGAQRYEPGTLNLPGAAAMNASLALLLELDVDAIAARLLELRAGLRAALEERGWRTVLDDLESDPEAARWRSGILTLGHDSVDVDELHQHLLGSGIVTSARKDRDGRTWLRLSPHAYTGDEDVARLLAAIDAAP